MYRENGYHLYKHRNCIPTLHSLYIMIFNYDSSTGVQVGFDPSSYTVLEGHQVELTIVNTGDTTTSFTLMLSTISGTAVGTVTQ